MVVTADLESLGERKRIRGEVLWAGEVSRESWTCGKYLQRLLVVLKYAVLVSNSLPSRAVMMIDTHDISCTVVGNQCVCLLLFP